MIGRRLALVTLAALALVGGFASAASATEQHPVKLTVTVEQTATLGQQVWINATLVDYRGDAIQGATITFSTPASWGNTASGDMVLGTALTNGQGVAAVQVPMAISGQQDISAVFEGDVRNAPATTTTSITVTGNAQLEQSHAGVVLPGITIWILIFLLLAVWGTYLVAAGHAIAIATKGARPSPAAEAPQAASGTTTTVSEEKVGRRDFGRHIAFPAIVTAGITALAGGLLAIIARSPKTHTNLASNIPPGYDRTPVAFVGEKIPMDPLPATLDKEMSFSADVLPILMSRAGPHVMMPNHSNPPGGMRLDTYQHLNMMTEVIVPGHPEKSLLVNVLRDPANRMPPVGDPLPTEQLQVIVTWIAQGAKNN
jgi:hypothetical protein